MIRNQEFQQPALWSRKEPSQHSMERIRSQTSHERLDVWFQVENATTMMESLCRIQRKHSNIVFTENNKNNQHLFSKNTLHCGSLSEARIANNGRIKETAKSWGGVDKTGEIKNCWNRFKQKKLRSDPNSSQSLNSTEQVFRNTSYYLKFVTRKMWRSSNCSRKSSTKNEATNSKDLLCAKLDSQYDSRIQQEESNRDIAETTGHHGGQCWKRVARAT